MKEKLKILIVDDHDLIIEGYSSIFRNQHEYEVAVTPAHDCEEANRIITNGSNNFDLIIIDWILPSDHEFKNGGDLVVLARRFMPYSKIIVITSHEEAFEIYDIVKKWVPSGVLVKIDVTAEKLLSAINIVKSGAIYFSETVQSCIKKVNSNAGYLDNYDRQIVRLLSKGIKTKNLPQHLPLSISAIDKRKAQIKDYFLVQGGGDECIVNEARKLGLI